MRGLPRRKVHQWCRCERVQFVRYGAFCYVFAGYELHAVFTWALCR